MHVHDVSAQVRRSKKLLGAQFAREFSNVEVNFVVLVKRGSFGKGLSAFRARGSLHFATGVRGGLVFSQKGLFALSAKYGGIPAIIYVKLETAFLFPAIFRAVFAFLPLQLIIFCLWDDAVCN